MCGGGSFLQNATERYSLLVHKQHDNFQGFPDPEVAKLVTKLVMQTCSPYGTGRDLGHEARVVLQVLHLQVSQLSEASQTGTLASIWQLQGCLHQHFLGLSSLWG